MEEKEQKGPAAATFRSISWRIGQMEDYARTGGDAFQGPLQYVPGDLDLLKLAVAPRLRVVPTMIYSREATRSYVMRVTSRLVCKVFGVERPGGGALLEPFEVEARYLRVFQHLMTAGIIDSSALLLGTCVMTRAEVEASGYMPSDATFFPEPRRSSGTYAVIFAEAGDTSVSSFLASLYKEPSYSRAALAYSMRALLFQIVYTLAAIHRLFPSYKHLDLHCSNWLVQRIDAAQLREQLQIAPDQPVMVEYAFGGRRWQVDLGRADFRLLLWDMNFASINAEDVEPYGLKHVVGRVREYNKIVPLAKSIRNQHVDLAKTVDTVRWVLSKGPSSVLQELPGDLRSLLERVIPLERSLAEVPHTDHDRRRPRLKVVHQPPPDALTPLKLLDDPVFAPLRVDARSRDRPRPVYRLKAHRQLRTAHSSSSDSLQNQASQDH